MGLVKKMYGVGRDEDGNIPKKISVNEAKEFLNVYVEKIKEQHPVLYADTDSIYLTAVPKDRSVDEMVTTMEQDIKAEETKK